MTNEARSIVAAAAARFGVTTRDVLGKMRTRRVALARGEAIRGVHALTFPGTEIPRYTLEELGAIFGLHHSTIAYHLGTIRAKQPAADLEV